MTLPNGIYDLLVTEDLAKRIDPDNSQIHSLDGDASELMSDLIGRQLSAILASLPGEGADHAQRQLELVNEVLTQVRKHLAGKAPIASPDSVVDLVSKPARQLKAIKSHGQYPSQPEIRLSTPWLFAASKNSPSLLQEIRRELASADRVDILVSFITVSGVRKLRDIFGQITAQSAAVDSAVKIRVLTTTYIGATEIQALDELARLPGCEVRVSLDGRRTRLHAKAWMFHRLTGFGSAYVGSANLSGAALTGGLEWTVKLSQHSQPAIFGQASAHFETLWADSEFQSYEPDNPDHRKALITALGRESGSIYDTETIVSFFDIEPKSYQLEVLEQLDSEREHGRTRNLVVAATGTGKTVIAAFDYRNTCRRIGGRPRLLFVAHREEILRQAMRTYREVLREADFGQLFSSGHEPSQYDHLFATIDILTSRDLIARHGADYWHTVVIDECHRLAADRFHSFAHAIRPANLLGLTATPERSDGRPISTYFDSRPDGSPAYELRLWHALDLQLLSPFEYYGCDDPTDFSAVPWERPGEREAISALVQQNESRAALVVNEWRRLCANPRLSKALVFCVSVAHAEFMADWLNRAGLPAACVVGTTAIEQRRKAPSELASGKLCALVTVDLYNEGVDLPYVDTLLLLRPTQSAVLFQQQIGRGLRLAKGKDSCLVLDFVGTHRNDFRFDRLFSSLTGHTKRELIDAVESGFNELPPGCHISLQRQTQAQVLASLRTLANQRWSRLRSELQAYSALQGRTEVRLTDFLIDQGLDIDDVYRSASGSTRSGWTSLKRDSGLLVSERAPEEDYFSRRFADLLHTDDSQRLDVYKALGKSKGRVETLGEQTASTLQMLNYQIDGRHGAPTSYKSFIDRLAMNADVCQELAELSDYLQSKSQLASRPILGLETTPLRIHASYGVREILTAVGWMNERRRSPFQAGVLPLPDQKIELLFVTLDKSSAYHDRVAYKDYAISVDRFHWETQNSAAPEVPSGQRYLDSPSNGWTFQLFIRPRKGDPYRACGPAVIESAEGSRPMSIVWKLSTPLPIRMFREFSILRAP